MSSTFEVEVVEVKLNKHPNADSLSIVNVHGWQVVVRTEDWIDGQLGAYIPPDSVVPDTEEYAFLKGHRHIRVARLRGELSWGLLMPAPAGASPGDDVAEQMGITHYEPVIHAGMNSNAESEPPGHHPHYDVQSYYRYPHLIQDGEEVVATEKIHGANGRWFYDGLRYWVGNHNHWLKADSSNIWWRTLYEHFLLGDLLMMNRNFTVYGEVYGSVQSLKYGKKHGEIELAIFDVLGPDGKWLDHDVEQEFLEQSGMKYLRVPELYRGPFDADKMKELSNGPSFVPRALHIREGIVVKPVVERRDPLLGRVQLKFVSPKYLEKSE